METISKSLHIFELMADKIDIVQESGSKLWTLEKTTVDSEDFVESEEMQKS